MKVLSDLIEEEILRLLSEAEGELQFRRAQLAEHLNCSPAQVTYVLQTRFSHVQGYSVESRRGGGGFILIKKISEAPKSQPVRHLLYHMPDEIGGREAEILISNLQASGELSSDLATVMKAVSRELSRPRQQKTVAALRAELLRAMLISFLTEERGSNEAIDQ